NVAFPRNFGCGKPHCAVRLATDRTHTRRRFFGEYDMVSIIAQTSGASAAGLATIAQDGTVLDVWFPGPQLSAQVDKAGTAVLSADQARALFGEAAAAALQQDPRRKTTMRAVRTSIG